MSVSTADAVVRQVNAIVCMLAAIIVTQENKVGSITEQERCVHGLGTVGRCQQERTSGDTCASPLHAPGTVMHQFHGLLQTVSCIGVCGAGNGTSVKGCGIGGQALTGYGVEIVGSLPTIGIPLILRQAFGPNLHIVQMTVVQRMTIRAHVAEGKVFTGDPVGGCLLRGGIDIVVVHGAQLFAVHAQIDHIGAIGRNLVGQAVDMLLGAVNAIISRTNAVVTMRRTVPVTDGDELTVLVTEQEGRIGDTTGSGGSQQHGTAAEAAGGLPLHDPGLVMLQNHTAVQAVNRLIHGAIGNVAMEQACLIKDIAAFGDRLEFITLQLPAVIIRAGGTHGRIINIVFKIADTVMIGIGSRLAAVGSKIELACGGTDGAILHLKETGISGTGHMEGQGRIVAKVTGCTLQIINQHCTLIDGLHIGIAGQRQENLAIVIIKALLGEGRIVSHLAIHQHIGDIQSTQLGQSNGSAGGGRIQSTGIEGSSALDQHLYLSIAGRHDLHSRHAGGCTVKRCLIGACRSQLRTADRQPNQSRTAGHEQIFLAVNRHDIQSIGMAQIGEIAVAGCGIGHQRLGAAVLVNTGNGSSGIIAASLCAVDICIIHRHTLHTVTAVLVIDHGQVDIAAIVLLGYRFGSIHSMYHWQLRNDQSKQQYHAQKHRNKSLHLTFHPYSPLISI